MSEGRRPPATASAQTHEVPSELPVLPLRDTVLFPGASCRSPWGVPAPSS